MSDLAFTDVISFYWTISPGLSEQSVRPHMHDTLGE